MKVYLTHSPQYIISTHIQLLAICCCHGIGLKVDCIFGILHFGVPVLCFSTFIASQSNFKVWNKHHRWKKSQYSMMQFCLQQGVIPMIAITWQGDWSSGRRLHIVPGKQPVQQHVQFHGSNIRKVGLVC